MHSVRSTEVFNIILSCYRCHFSLPPTELVAMTTKSGELNTKLVKLNGVIQIDS